MSTAELLNFITLLGLRLGVRRWNPLGAPARENLGLTLLVGDIRVKLGKLNLV